MSLTIKFTEVIDNSYEVKQKLGEDLFNELLETGVLHPIKEKFACNFGNFKILREYVKYKWNYETYSVFFLDEDKLTTLINDYYSFNSDSELLVDILGFNYNNKVKEEIKSTISTLAPYITKLKRNIFLTGYMED